MAHLQQESVGVFSQNPRYSWCLLLVIFHPLILTLFLGCNSSLTHAVFGDEPNLSLTAKPHHNHLCVHHSSLNGDCLSMCNRCHWTYFILYHPPFSPVCPHFNSAVSTYAHISPQRLPRPHPPNKWGPPISFCHGALGTSFWVWAEVSPETINTESLQRPEDSLVQVLVSSSSDNVSADEGHACPEPAKSFNKRCKRPISTWRNAKSKTKCKRKKWKVKCVCIRM